MTNQMTVNKNTMLTPEDMMINVLQTQKEHKQQLGSIGENLVDHNRRITELELKVPINASLNNFLTKLRNRKIVGYLGGKRAKAYKYKYPEKSTEHYKTLSSKVYAEAERRFKSTFNVRVYAEIKQHEYEEAVLFWENYEPSKRIINEINQINNQLELLQEDA